MSIFGCPGDETFDLTYVVVDKEEEPRRFLETILLFMTCQQAQQLCDYLQQHISTSPMIAVALHSGRRKKGNPVIGEDVYEQDY